MTSYELRTETLPASDYDSRRWVRVDRFEHDLGGSTLEIRKARRRVDGAPGWCVYVGNSQIAWAESRTGAIAEAHAARRIFFAISQPERAALAGGHPSGPTSRMVPTLRWLAAANEAVTS